MWIVWYNCRTCIEYRLAITFVETLGNSGMLREEYGSGIRYRCGHINVYRWCLDA